MKCIAKINDLNIIFSGTAILSNTDDTFSATIDTEKGTKLTFQLTFIDTEGDNNPQIKTEVRDGIAQITCINFKNALGTGLKEPANVATLLGKKIYILFWAYSLGASSKKIDYMFLMED